MIHHVVRNIALLLERFSTPWKYCEHVEDKTYTAVVTPQLIHSRL